MSDTPETDAAVLASDWGWSLVLKERCRRLERERNKAEAGWSECRDFGQRVVDERDEAMARSIVRLEQENDELRAANAVGEQERAILVRELEKLREQIASYRATRLTDEDDGHETCYHKEAADRIGGNPWSAW